MHTLTLDEGEQSLLVEIVEAQLATLPHEIHQTDHRAYREMLEARKQKLEQLLAKLKSA